MSIVIEQLSGKLTPQTSSLQHLSAPFSQNALVNILNILGLDSLIWLRFQLKTFDTPLTSSSSEIELSQIISLKPREK